MVAGGDGLIHVLYDADEHVNVVVVDVHICPETVCVFFMHNNALVLTVIGL